ncbi:5735_t:CDS:1 [Acaulospora morrowiae]|uniref:5735_t:CDS:1 n=1 Tax=Acaulospora morrowiae TaxID=94023 RepID=A0A9N9FPG2_9GLOM|nr:5735_t:CDS:1 [Acaulospora morrowiae]
MSCLPGDCLLMIFAHFEDDECTLYACVLVNRLWCLSAIKLLWRNPFLFVRPANGLLIELDQLCSTNGKFMNTLMECLIHNQKIEHEEDSPAGHKNQQLFDGITHELSRPTFNYVQFIRHLDLVDLGSAIVYWVEYNFSSKFGRSIEEERTRDAIIASLLLRVTRVNHKESIIKGLTNRICQLLVQQITKLDVLTMNRQISVDIDESLENLQENILFDNIADGFLSITTCPEANTCFSHLVELEWIVFVSKESWTTTGFHEMSKYCHNLQKMVLDMNDIMPPSAPPELMAFITSQKSLLEFELLNCDIKSAHIALGLKSQSKSLTRLTFVCVNVLRSEYISDVVHLANLEELTFINGSLVNQETWPLSFVHFPRLVKYKLYDLDPPVISVNQNVAIASSSCSMLTSIIYTCMDFPVGSNADSFLDTVGRRCKSLNHFEIDAVFTALQPLISIFSLPNLESINLNTAWADIVDIERLLTSGQISPKLRKLVLEGPWKFTAEALETFFTNLISPLDNFVLTESECLEGNHLEIILKYMSSPSQRFHISKYRETDMEIQKNRDSLTYIVKDIWSASYIKNTLLPVIRYCKDLTYFKCEAEVGSITSIMSVLYSSPKLETLIIKRKEFSANVDLMFQMQLLCNLNHLELHGKWKFTPLALDTFLAKSKPPLDTLEITRSECFSDVHLQVVLCRLRGIIKRFKVNTSIILSEEVQNMAKDIIENFEYSQSFKEENILASHL